MLMTNKCSNLHLTVVKMKKIFNFYTKDLKNLSRIFLNLGKRNISYKYNIYQEQNKLTKISALLKARDIRQIHYSLRLCNQFPPCSPL